MENKTKYSTKKGISFLFVIGSYGGFHATKSDGSIHICLGFVAFTLFFYDVENVFAQILLKEQQPTKTEAFNIPDVVRSTANIEIAIKHFERRRDEYKGRLSADEVLKTLYFLKQANEQGLDIIGVGYTRYDGGDIKECSVKNMYECGFLVRK